MSSEFAAADLALLRDEEEVDIETAASDESPAHRAIIWVVVDEQDRVLIRSYRGPDARWYREITARPEATIHAGERAIPVRAVPAGDPERVQACTDALRTKYAGQHSMPVMLRQYLKTTLELVAR